MKGIKKVSEKIFSFLPYLIVFIFSLYQPADPDLGWHLKYGEYFFQHGTVLRDNTFSTMMPNFHWANTSWLTDIISYSAYHLGGLFGLTLLGALVVTLTFYFFAKAFHLTLWEQTIVFPVVLYLEEPINVISFRGQQLALLCVGILFYLISLYEKKPKTLWFAIPLFMFWAAVDGEFLLGCALFGLWLVVYSFKKILPYLFENVNKKGKIKKAFSFSFTKLIAGFSKEKKEIGFLFVVFFASILATFINPYGYGIHLDALSHIGSPLLKDIAEYLPFPMLSQEWWNEVIVGVVLVFGLFILFFKRKFIENFPFIAGGIVLFFLSIQVRRYAWPAYYLLIPLLAMTATFLKPDSKKAITIATNILLVILLALAILMRGPFTNFTNFSWDEYCLIQVAPCSSNSAKYLEKHHLTKNLYSLYGWGGWLIWNYPDVKPLIDGRMHLWVEKRYSAFTDYYWIEQNESDIDESNYDIAYMSPQKPVYNRLMQLVQEGKWKLVYKDRYAGIFVRNR